MATIPNDQDKAYLDDAMQVQTVHLEALNADPEKTRDSDEASLAEEATGENLPEGYYYSVNFIGTFVVCRSFPESHVRATRWCGVVLTNTFVRPSASRPAPCTCIF